MSSLQLAVRKIVTTMDADGHTDTLLNLSDRWTAEKEYEDFNDYEDVMKSAFVGVVAVIKATKRPFGFTAMVDTTKLHFFLKRKGGYVSLNVKHAK